jgi:hypothetical protein
MLAVHVRHRSFRRQDLPMSEQVQTDTERATLAVPRPCTHYSCTGVYRTQPERLWQPAAGLWRMLVPPAAADQLEASVASTALFMTQCVSSSAFDRFRSCPVVARTAFVMHRAPP